MSCIPPFLRHPALFLALSAFLCKMLATMFLFVYLFTHLAIYMKSPSWSLPLVRKLTDDLWNGASFSVVFIYLFIYLFLCFASLVSFLLLSSSVIGNFSSVHEYVPQRLMMSEWLPSVFRDLDLSSESVPSEMSRRIWNRWSSLLLCQPKMRLIYFFMGMNYTKRQGLLYVPHFSSRFHLPTPSRLSNTHFLPVHIGVMHRYDQPLSNFAAKPLLYHISRTTRHFFSLAPTHAHENTRTISLSPSVMAVSLEELLDAPTTMSALAPRSTSTTPSRELLSPSTSLPSSVASPPHLLLLLRRSPYPVPSKLVFNFRSVVSADTSRKAIILNALEPVPRSTSLPYWSN